MSRMRARTPELEIAALFGAGIDWQRESGIVHVAAIGAHPRCALAIGPAAPASRTDRFVLGFARARADAIVTTSAILRAEPELVQRASDDPEEEAAWQRWRSGVLGRRDAPECVVVSQSGQVPLDHPALRGPGRATVVTTVDGRARLAFAARSVEVVVVGDPVVEGVQGGGGMAGPEHLLSRAIGWLQRRRGAGTVVLEAGPRSTVGLYGQGAGDPELARIDELLLSVFDGGSFEAVAGPALPEPEALACYFGGDPKRAPRSRCRRTEASGPWDFERYRRDG
ncbi:MAG: hypothetical protein IPK00_09910 [Deltaproteobacteria bacterium]|nr:hypothetical protein [Deltaproteobacteria bacterium]